MQAPDGAAVFRLATSLDAGERVVAALEALDGEPFAPRLLGWRNVEERGRLIAMADVEGWEPSHLDVQNGLGTFIGVLCRLHSHAAFGRAVESVGCDEPLDFSYREWALEQWAALQTGGVRNLKLDRAASWVDVLQATEVEPELRQSVLVAGHGDMHLPNWRLTSRGPVLLDWEDIRRFPFAPEIAGFIVWAGLDPRDVGRRYRAPSSYIAAIEEDALGCALGLLVKGLRAAHDGRRVPEWLGHVEGVCMQLFSKRGER